MTSPHWSRHNRNVLLIGLTISALVVFGLQWFFSRPALAAYGAWSLIAFSIATVGCIGTIYFYSRRNPDMMRRVLKMNHADAEFALRKLFKEKHIHFIRNEEFGFYEFEFPHRNLNLLLYPYDPHHGIVAAPEKMNPKGVGFPETQLTIPGINASNNSFAQDLALAVDEMASRIAMQDRGAPHK